MSLARKTILGLLCGLITGAVILGVGGRIVMSVIALLEHLTPSWSLGGSGAVVAFGAIVGAVSGLAYVVVMQYLPGSRLTRGMLAGLLLFGTMALLPPRSAQTAMSGFDHLLLPVLLLFGMICLAYGGALAVAVDILGKRWEKKKI